MNLLFVSQTGGRVKEKFSLCSCRAGAAMPFAAAPGSVRFRPLIKSNVREDYRHLVRVLGAVMSDYRLYLIGQDGHFSRAINLDCKGDDAAKAEAIRRADGQGVELWSSARCVAMIPATPEEGGPARKRKGLLAILPFMLGGEQADL